MEDKESIIKMLTKAGFRPAPRGIEVHLASSDGAYFNVSNTGDDIQLLIVGPMMHSPVEYAEMLENYWVKSASFLEPSGSANDKQLMIERGFISIILRNYNVQARPGGLSSVHDRGCGQ